MTHSQASKLPAGFVDRMAAIVGDAGLLTDADAIEPFLTEPRGTYRGNTALVIRPGSTAELAQVVAACAAERVAMVPQGGGTGLCGGAVPSTSGEQVVISLARMNKIRSLDPQSFTMTVEAGVVLEAIQEAAAQHDRLFPLSLAAQGSCTIGGNLSTNAGGVHVLHYGNARQLVLGLEVVTPAGEIWNGLRALKKDNTGYDLRDLYLGAEGTLGIITRAVLKLWPRPKDTATAWIAVPSPEAAVALLSGAHAASEDNVTSCELMGRQGIDLVLKEGLNVKVVTFPEGEDPDSFAKSHSSSEVSAYLAGNAQDFLVFKSALLMAEVGDDPVQVGMMTMGVVDTMMVGHLSPTALAAVALGNVYYFGVSIFGHGMFYDILKRYEVTHVAPLTLMTPVWAVLIGSLALNEPLTPQLLTGGALALTGVFMIAIRPNLRLPDAAAIWRRWTA